MEDRKRILWVDSLRGFLMLTVLLAHCRPPFEHYILGFHMPAFFILSGYLLKEETPELWGGWLRKSFKHLIIPYFVLCFINLIFCSVFYYESVRKIFYYIGGILYSRGTTEWMPNCSPLWFLTAYFVAHLIFLLIRKIKNGRLRILVIILCPTVSWLLDLFNIVKLPWNIDTALMAVLFIYLGYLLKKLEILEKIRKYSVFAVLSIPVLCAVGFFAIKNNQSVNFDNNFYGNPILMIIGAATWTLLLLIIFSGIPEKIAAKDFFFTFFGKNTILMMGFDYLFGTLVYELLAAVGYSKWYLWFVCKLVLITVFVVIYNLLKRVFQRRKL